MTKKTSKPFAKTSATLKISKHPTLSRYWMYGQHAVRYALLNPKRRIHQCVHLPTFDLASLPPLTPTIPCQEIDKHTMQKLVGEESVHQGIAIEVSALDHKPLDSLLNDNASSQLFMVLDHVVDPHNVGAILRSCAVFGVTALMMTERHSPKESGILAKTACGALDIVPMIYVTNLAQSLKFLQTHGFWTVGLAEKGATSLEKVNWTGKMAIIMGAEGDGMRPLTKEYCDILAHLPTSPNFSTLNVSNAAAITLFEAFKGQAKG